MIYHSLLTDNSPCVIFREFWISPCHWHSEVEIVYCVHGSLTILIDGNVFVVNAGQIIFIGSAEPHECIDGSADAKFLLIQMGEYLLKKDFQDLSKRSFDQPVMVPTEKLLNLFDTILTELKQPDSTGGEWVITGCLFELAAYMLRELPGRSDISGQRIDRIRAMQSVSKSMEYIRMNYQKKISVEEIVQLSGHGKSNFCKQFKKATQMTFHKYLNVFRINRACIMLSGGYDSIAAIAKETGFLETKTFCRVFRETMNVTPTEYRKLYNPYFK